MELKKKSLFFIFSCSWVWIGIQLNVLLGMFFFFPEQGEGEVGVDFFVSCLFPMCSLRCSD
jgi:hypothetical protein